MTDSNFHYFASTVFGWATADTEDAAIKKLVAHFKSDLKAIVKNAHKNGEPGAYVWTAKVLAPADAKYDINYYAPVGVDYTDGTDHYVTYLTDKDVAYWSNTEKTKLFYKYKVPAVKKAKLAKKLAASTPAAYKAAKNADVAEAA